MGLKYGGRYNLTIAGEEYKGIYLGEYSRKGLRRKGVFLVDKLPPYNMLAKFSFSLVRFKDYRFDENNKIVLNWMSYISPAKKEINYLEELSKRFG
jgi:hypothetical protein